MIALKTTQSIQQIATAFARRSSLTAVPFKCMTPSDKSFWTLHNHRPSFRCYSAANDETREKERSKTRLSEIGRKIRDAVVAQSLPLSFVSTMALGYLWPNPGVILANANFTKYCTFGVFIASGLLLERKEAAKAINSKGSLLFGLASILLLTPLAAPLMLALPLEPKELVLGLAVFMITPTTLSTGVTLVQAAHANVAMALLLTLLSNFISVFTIPVTLSLIMDSAVRGGLALSPLVLLKNLTWTILTPTLGAYTLKTAISGVREWVRQRRKRVSNFGSFCLMLIPWMQVSKASMSGIAIDPSSLAIAVGVGVAMHLIFFSGNHFLARAFNLGATTDQRHAMALRRAVVLMSSQKSVTIAIAVLTQLSAYLPPEAIGIACVPCVLVHLCQTVIDSFIASYWARTYRTATT